MPPARVTARTSTLKLTRTHHPPTHPHPGKRGWLERQDESSAFVRRFFVLECKVRQGVREAAIEYYLDEGLTPDEDAETIPIGNSTVLRQTSDAAAGRQHVLELCGDNGRAIHMLAASGLTFAHSHASNRNRTLLASHPRLHPYSNPHLRHARCRNCYHGCKPSPPLPATRQSSSSPPHLTLSREEEAPFRAHHA